MVPGAHKGGPWGTQGWSLGHTRVVPGAHKNGPMIDNNNNDDCFSKSPSQKREFVVTVTDNNIC